ncbi:hypothetical protein [Fluviispira sanaruensis]|uniref:Uncharacterized protein n=1 Tax=Fluviispira sanaruensis TaxID=2493639 RepID=A0A4P2VJZ2_FLUSA|nr:hypothetical protein [Fluviispira sanaruensis]BBH53526.1 hypothetical protein JCM31447_19700 [Fluviispira sanaruensis]
MIQRFLTIAELPELRPDPIQTDKSIPELEVIIPVDIYWQIQDIIKNMRYARVSDFSIDRHWRDFIRLIYPCILLEKDRLWFRRNVG